MRPSLQGCCHLFSTYAPAVVLPLRAPNTSSYGGSDLREDRHAVALIVITLDASTSAILLGQRIGRSHRTPDVCGTLETLPVATLDLRQDLHHRAELNKTSRRSATRTEQGQVPHGFGTGFGRLHRQLLCGRVIPAIGLRGYVSPHMTVTVLLHIDPGIEGYH